MRRTWVAIAGLVLGAFSVMALTGVVCSLAVAQTINGQGGTVTTTDTSSCYSGTANIKYCVSSTNPDLGSNYGITSLQDGMISMQTGNVYFSPGSTTAKIVIPAAGTHPVNGVLLDATISSGITIDAYGSCKSVTLSSTGAHRFIPLRSSKEWQSFVTNASGHPGVTLNSCVYQCLGSLPTGAVQCSLTVALADNTTSYALLAGACYNGAPACSVACDQANHYQYSNGACTLVPPSCTSPISRATACGNNPDPTTTTPWVAVNACVPAAQCQAQCDNGYMAVGGSCVAVCDPNSATITAGSGTGPSPYLICNCQQLQSIPAGSGSVYQLSQDIDCSGGADFTPLTDFSGVFDGNKSVISGLHVNQASGNAGLFGNTIGATIKNVGLIGGSVQGTTNVGGFVGVAQDINSSIGTSIINSYNANAVTGNFYVGGLVGYALSMPTSITDSYNAGVITGTAGAGWQTSSIAGLAGYFFGPITRSYNIGAVSANGLVVNVAGGLVGYYRGDMTDSFNAGPLSVSAFMALGVGDLAGVAQMNTFTNSWYTANAGVGNPGDAGTFLAGSAADFFSLSHPVYGANWDFGTVWQGVTCNFPNLRDAGGLQNAANGAGYIHVGNSCVLPIAITTTSLTFGDRTVAYSAAIATSGGSGAKAWSVSAGSLPAGLAINAGTGVISGTPTVTGTSNFTVKVTDLTGSATEALSIVIYNPITVSVQSLPNGTVGSVYGPVSPVATGGGTPLTWTLNLSYANNTLPLGLALTPVGGIISGTPTQQTGLKNYWFDVTDGVSTYIGAQVQIKINSAITANPQTLPDGKVGDVYGPVNPVASGGTPPYTWTLNPSYANNTLPPGLTLTPVGGIISGTPTQSAGLKNMYFDVTDGHSTNTGVMVQIKIISAITANTQALPDGKVGDVYGPVNPVASGGTPPYTWTLNPGPAYNTLPPGLTLTPLGGVISGTATQQQAQKTLYFDVTDGSSTNTMVNVIIKVNSAITANTQALPDGKVGDVYGPVNPVASGGTPPYTWTLNPGPAYNTLPPGLTLTPLGGVISGTATQQQAQKTLYFDVTDGSSTNTMVNVIIKVNSAITTANAQSLPDGKVGVAYGPVSPVASGGTPPYTWTLNPGPANNTLPPGLILTPQGGIISGTPSQVQAQKMLYFDVTDGHSTNTMVNVLIKVSP
ncbi:MAG: putative Ig domain-containing protein [Candidatus Omnitrophota bacterium]